MNLTLLLFVTRWAGMPSGLDLPQWLRAIKAEHCEVEAGKWGCSEMEWTTGNYGLKTTPAKEYRLVAEGVWDGEKRDNVVGAMQKDPQTREWLDVEDPQLARKVVDLVRLSQTHPLSRSMIDSMPPVFDSLIVLHLL